MKNLILGAFGSFALVACMSAEPIEPLTGAQVTQRVSETLLHKGVRGAGPSRDARLVERTYTFGCLTDFPGDMSTRVATAKASALQHSGYVLPGTFALNATRRGITVFTNRRAQAATGCALRSASDEVLTSDPLEVLAFSARPAVALELSAEK